MYATCGCSDEHGVRVIELSGREHDHPHPSRADGHDHSHASVTLTLEERVLAKNDQIRAENRRWLPERFVRAVNIMSSPGAGKTTLLERTLRELGRRLPMAVVEGD